MATNTFKVATDTFRINEKILGDVRKEVFSRKANGNKITIAGWIEEAIREKLKTEKWRNVEWKKKK